jgi:AcrR family transcriptional regulator
MGTREQIIKVASELFAEQGFDGVSIRDITSRAEVNLSAVTYHFGSKEALFGAVILLKIEPLREIGRRVAAMERPPREKLHYLLLESSLHILHKDPALKVFFTEALQGGRRLPPEGVGAIVERNRLIHTLLEEGIRLGEFRPCDVECATWVFFGMLVPYVIHQPLINPEHRLGAYTRDFVEHIVRTALDLYFIGVLERKSS